MKIGIMAKSRSGGDPYKVEFTKKGGKLSVFCSCMAGIHRQNCHHKTRLLEGDQSVLENPSDSKKLSQLLKWVDQSAFPRVINELHQLETELHKIQQKMKTLKDDLANGCKDGC